MVGISPQVSAGLGAGTGLGSGAGFVPGRRPASANAAAAARRRAYAASLSAAAASAGQRHRSPSVPRPGSPLLMRSNCTTARGRSGAIGGGGGGGGVGGSGLLPLSSPLPTNQLATSLGSSPATILGMGSTGGADARFVRTINANEAASFPEPGAYRRRSQEHLKQQSKRPAPVVAGAQPVQEPQITQPAVDETVSPRMVVNILNQFRVGNNLTVSVKERATKSSEIDQLELEKPEVTELSRVRSPPRRPQTPSRLPTCRPRTPSRPRTPVGSAGILRKSTPSPRAARSPATMLPHPNVNPAPVRAAANNALEVMAAVAVGATRRSARHDAAEKDSIVSSISTLWDPSAAANGPAKAPSAVESDSSLSSASSVSNASAGMEAGAELGAELGAGAGAGCGANAGGIAATGATKGTPKAPCTIVTRGRKNPTATTGSAGSGSGSASGRGSGGGSGNTGGRARVEAARTGARRTRPHPASPASHSVGQLGPLGPDPVPSPAPPTPGSPRLSAVLVGNSPTSSPQRSRASSNQGSQQSLSALMPTLPPALTSGSGGSSAGSGSGSGSGCDDMSAQAHALASARRRMALALAVVAEATEREALRASRNTSPAPSEGSERASAHQSSSARGYSSDISASGVGSPSEAGGDLGSTGGTTFESGGEGSVRAPDDKAEGAGGLLAAAAAAVRALSEGDEAMNASPQPAVMVLTARRSVHVTRARSRTRSRSRSRSHSRVRLRSASQSRGSSRRGTAMLRPGCGGGEAAIEQRLEFNSDSGWSHSESSESFTESIEGSALTATGSDTGHLSVTSGGDSGDRRSTDSMRVMLSGEESAGDHPRVMASGERQQAMAAGAAAAVTELRNERRANGRNVQIQRSTCSTNRVVRLSISTNGRCQDGRREEGRMGGQGRALRTRRVARVPRGDETARALLAAQAARAARAAKAAHALKAVRAHAHAVHTLRTPPSGEGSPRLWYFRDFPKTGLFVLHTAQRARLATLALCLAATLATLAAVPSRPQGSFTPGGDRSTWRLLEDGAETRDGSPLLLQRQLICTCPGLVSARTPVPPPLARMALLAASALASGIAAAMSGDSALVRLAAPVAAAAVFEGACGIFDAALLMVVSSSVMPLMTALELGARAASTPLLLLYLALPVLKRCHSTWAIRTKPPDVTVMEKTRACA